MSRVTSPVRWGCGFAVLVLLAGFALGPAEAGINNAPGPKARLILAQPQDVIGNLTWTGRGGIDWGESNPSQDYSPGADPRTWTPNLNHSIAVPAQYPPPPIVFTSDPMPADVSLNVSRDIELWLRLKPQGSSNACDYGRSSASFEIRIFVETRFLGGQVDGHDRFSWPTSLKADADGFRPCIYAVNAEISVIRAGERVKIEIQRVASNYCVVPFANAPYPCAEHTFGMSAGHRSFIRFPVYDELDAALRAAPLAPLEKAPPSAEGGGVGLAGLALLIGLPGVATRHREGKRTSAVLGIILLVASGCLGNPASPANTDFTGATGPGFATQEIVPALNRSDGNASLVGQVMDTFGLPVPSAHVLLLGREAFSKTDSLGRFSLNDLGPGTVRIRVDKTGFEPFEGTVELREGQTTRLRVQIQKTGLSEDMAKRPHYHDYWGGTEERVIFDGSVDGTYFEIPESETQKALILPGTVEVEISIRWPNTFRASRVGVMFQEAWMADVDYQARNNWSMLFPRPKGVPFHLQTNWDMTDNGHAPSSVWAFRLFTVGYDPPRTTERTPDESLRPYAPTVAAPIPPFDVTITIRKGVLPLEAAHTDHWKGRAEFEIVNPVFKTGKMSNTNYPMRPPRVVPFDTASIVVRLSENESTRPFKGWQLSYKPGDSKISNSCLDMIWYGQGTRATCQENAKPAPDPRIEGRTYEWRFQLQPGEADEIYSGRSRWVLNFLPTVDGEDQARASNLPTNVAPSWSVMVTVVRDGKAAT